jgi:glycosyltransferase involved in cell wall biosynthesis
MSMLSYVVITPARNEAEFIAATIESVLAQTVRPLAWMIVSDGSTDGTDEIVLRYTAQHPWIRLIRMPERRERHFGGKAHAFNAGYEQVRTLPFDVVANLDADISVDPDYFAYLLAKLADDSNLGVAGTPFQEGSNPIYDYRFVNIEHVSGACQLFRRQCLEQIGGYTPVKGGCVDHIAVLTARMNGWKTRTFTDRVCRHHRTMGTAQAGVLLARFRNGAKDYAIGNHPLWQVCRTAYQATRTPFLVGGVMVGLGYLWAFIRRAERPVSKELMAFQRREQMQRLRRTLGVGTGSAPRLPRSA